MEQNLFIYNRAAELLFERFPMLGLSLHSADCKQTVQEPLPKLEIAKAEIVYFYGLSGGKIYSECKQWLRKSPHHQLVILENDINEIASFLHTPLAIELLEDAQVHLEHLTSHSDEEIEALVSQRAKKRVEVSGLKSKNGLEELRLKILRKTALAYALHMDRRHGYQPFSNFYQNLKHLSGSFYANRLIGQFKNVPAVVCGAGPSLESTIETLKKLENKALIIAGGSTLAALSSKGIIPHLGMAIDPNLEEYRRLKNSFCFEMPLLYSTRVHPDIFQTCNGPFGYMRSGIGGIPELWVEEELGLNEPLLGQNLSPETVSVTGICLALAVEMGCNPILINGVDLAYTDNKHYADGVTDEGELELQQIDREKSAADQILKTKDRLGKDLFTAVRWVMEATSISEYAKNHPNTQFINTTEGGLGFQGIEFQPIEEVAKGFSESNLRQKVFSHTNASCMPEQTDQVIQKLLNDLKCSLDRSIKQLQILSGEEKGSTALAEVDLMEEMAVDYLFYDIKHILNSSDEFWKEWLELAKQYRKVIAE